MMGEGYINVTRGFFLFIFIPCEFFLLDQFGHLYFVGVLFCDDFLSMISHVL